MFFKRKVRIYESTSVFYKKFKEIAERDYDLKVEQELSRVIIRMYGVKIYEKGSYDFHTYVQWGNPEFTDATKLFINKLIKTIDNRVEKYYEDIANDSIASGKNEAIIFEALLKEKGHIK